MSQPIGSPEPLVARGLWDTDPDPARSRPTMGTVTMQGDGLLLERQRVMERPDLEWRAAEGSEVLSWSQIAAYGASGPPKYLALETEPSIGYYLALELSGQSEKDHWVAALDHHGVEGSLPTGPASQVE